MDGYCGQCGLNFQQFTPLYFGADSKPSYTQFLFQCKIGLQRISSIFFDPQCYRFYFMNGNNGNEKTVRSNSCNHNMPEDGSVSA